MYLLNSAEGIHYNEKTVIKILKMKRLQLNQREITPECFWHSVNIFLNKPHVVNKRIRGCKTWFRIHTNSSDGWKTPSQINRLKCSINSENLDHCKEAILSEVHLQEGDQKSATMELILSELLPKSVSETQVVQLILLDNLKCAVHFYDVSQVNSTHRLCPDFPFSVQLRDNDIVLNTACEVSNITTYQWLTNTLIPQLVKWTADTNTNHNQSICKDSLSLVEQNQYYVKYNELKDRYGKDMVKIWPECTDPTKFVYEDVAIATYLLLLWEQYSSKKQRFVDLGCGNGLLVYILTKEGHCGVGYDVRRRNIWDMYKDVLLEEKTIVPSDKSLFPESDWIIGNHSDELTPWIPVIAAKSSYNCNFFLLPCCAYNFDGTKYQRRNSNKSQYMDYLEYTKDLCMDCGFNVEVDRLKIPSTKRICLVSKGRVYTEEKYSEHCIKIDNIISKDSSECINTVWLKDFKARDPVERVRNCTQIDKNLINSIVKCIVDYLLDDVNVNSTWSAGKALEIGELIQLISKDQLKHLKAECGGLQTLLKNNHNIFKVHSGKVQIRYPKSVDEISKNSPKIVNLKVKQKSCWFYNNHPQGCPLSGEKCSFKHNE